MYNHVHARTQQQMLHGIHVQCTFNDIWGTQSWTPISSSHLIGMFNGSGILLSPTLVVTCAHVVSEKQEDPTDPTWAHFRRTSITVNAIPANILSAGNLNGPNPDPDIAFLRLQTPLPQTPASLYIAPPDHYRVSSLFLFLMILVCVFHASHPPRFVCALPTSSPPHHLHRRRS
jgi:hypothetical protein